jgi:hypothetical protein
MNVRDALLTIAAIAMLVYLRPAWPQTLLDNPSSCKCAPANWPPAGKWQADSGKGNLGQNFHSEHTEVWTHACASGGMCGAEVKDVLQWTRTGIGAQACPGSRTLSSNYDVQTAPTLQTLQTQLCDVARAGGKFQSDGAASFGGVQVYLNCPL